MGEKRQVISRIAAWAGSEARAMAWYCAQPIPAFCNRTAQDLVQHGESKALLDYLDHVASGGFAQ
jgi:hypothetical protein